MKTDPGQHLTKETKKPPSPPKTTAASVRTAPSRTASKSRQFRSRVPNLAAAMAALAGVLTLWSAATRPFTGRMELIQDWMPLNAAVGARILAAQLGLLLLVLAGQLKRRKHRAWLAAVVTAAMAAAAHMVKGLDLEEALAHLTLLAVLLYGRREFYAKSDPPSLISLFRFVPVYFGGLVVFGAAALLINRRIVIGEVSFSSALATSATAIVGIDGPLQITNTVIGRSYDWAMSILGTIGCLIAGYILFRPVLEGLVRHPDEREQAREIVRSWGWDSLAYFALRDDKNYFFSDSGDAFLAYRYVNGIACISGDPIGNPDSIPGMLAAFREAAHSRGWKIAILAGREDTSHLYTAMGLKSYYLGDEAIIDLDEFSLEGRKIRKVRQSCHRLTKAGYSTELIPAADVIGSQLEGQLEAISNKWRGKAPERGFSMALGRPLGEADADCFFLVARDAEGVPRGYLRLVPFFGASPGYSLDQMRRDPDTPNGLMEYLVVAACRDLKSLGLRQLSLNFAAFARLLSGEIPLTWWQRVQRAIVKRFNPFFQIESLLKFNQKFFPRWVSRRIYYEEGVNLVRVGLSYLEIEALVPIRIVRRLFFPHLDLVER